MIIYESKLREAKLIFRRSSVDHKKEKHNFNSNVDQFTERKIQFQEENKINADNIPPANTN